MIGTIALSGCSDPAQRQALDRDYTAQSEALVLEYQTRLQSTLGEALAEGGPVSAIAVCKVQAPIIAAELSSGSGAQIRRVASRNRNPDNSLRPGLAAMYSKLETQPVKEGRPAALHSQLDGAFVYMSALPMAEKPCTICHGTQIAPEVQKAITAAYPDDRATGFAPGDMRGAFVVEWTLKGSE